jgi:hypothetical protein
LKEGKDILKNNALPFAKKGRFFCQKGAVLLPKRGGSFAEKGRFFLVKDNDDFKDTWNRRGEINKQYYSFQLFSVFMAQG